jgi:flagellar L-ring protein precursor FlgH
MITLVAGLFSGCATPKPAKIDISKVPVQAGTIPATRGSIWPGETSRNTFFQDLRARNIGDIVTIIISEKTSAVKEATTSTSRKSDTDIGITGVLGLPLNFGMENFLGRGNEFSPNVNSRYDAGFDGSGKTERSGELSAVISARVVEVLANGNLVLEGKKDTVVNNELQYIIISGIVRPEDIKEDNTILSELISDARIEYSGRGVVSDEQNVGWLRRVLDNVWPL